MFWARQDDSSICIHAPQNRNRAFPVCVACTPQDTFRHLATPTPDRLPEAPTTHSCGEVPRASRSCAALGEDAKRGKDRRELNGVQENCKRVGRK